jgi:hypothetical protein
VPGLLFFDKDYSTLLYVLSQANMLITLSNPDKDVTLLATNNEKLEEYGIRYDATNEVVEFRGPLDGKWSEMNTQNLIDFAQSQIIFDPYSDFSGNGYIETASGAYIHYSNNQIQASENQAKGEPANFVEALLNDRNGYLVKVDRPAEVRYVIGQYLVDNPDVSKFSDLLVDFNMLNLRVKDPITKEVIPNLKFYAGSQRWTALIPNNDAMQKAYDEGILPEGSGRTWFGNLSTGQKDSITNWINYHFIRGNVVFDDGSTASQMYDTNFNYLSEDGKTNLYTKIEINNDPNNLSIHDATGQVVVVDRAKANNLTKKGVAHILDTPLKYYE